MSKITAYQRFKDIKHGNISHYLIYIIFSSLIVDIRLTTHALTQHTITNEINVEVGYRVMVLYL